MHDLNPARHFEPAYLSLLEDGRLSLREYRQALDLAASHGLDRLDSRHHRRSLR